MLPPHNIGNQENSFQGSPFPNDVVHQQVARIISGRAFRKSNRLQRLLKFIVDATVSGEMDSLKEWVIGTDVYDRGKDFDPRLDPIVRTECRRLRRKLNEYYETEGREDDLVIEVPKGSYIPNFRTRRDDDLFKLPGETIDGYVVLERLDESPDSVTYRVRENISGHVFALTVISGVALAQPGAREALDADFRAATALHHENICRIYKIEHSGLNICVTIEYFAGLSVTDVVDRRAPAWGQTIEIVQQLIRGLSAAHCLQIVQGNLHPGNVLVLFDEVSEKPVVKIVDFGMRFLAGRRNSGTDEKRSDVYGAGTVLHKLFTGSLPECGTSDIVWRQEIPEEYRPALGAVLARCLAPNPADRYADAMELERALHFLTINRRLAARNEDKQSRLSATLREAMARLREIMGLAGRRRYVAAALLWGLAITAPSGALWVRRQEGSRPTFIRRLAVLPVECPSGDQECELLGRAFTASLNRRLTKTNSLDVVTVDAARQPKGMKMPLSEIGSRLTVDHVLTGTIDKTSNTRRFTERIIRVEDEAVELTSHFECSWETLLEIQSRVVSDVIARVDGFASRRQPQGDPSGLAETLKGAILPAASIP